MEDTREIAKTQGALIKQFTTVTRFSKYLSIFLFVTLPFIGGWLGYEYAQKVTGAVENVTYNNQHDNAVAKSHATTSRNSLENIAFVNQELSDQPYFVRDAGAVYVDFGINGPTVVDGADPDTFVALTCSMAPEGVDICFGKDKHRAYISSGVTEEWKEPDAATLEFVWGPVMKDKDAVFFGEEVFAVAEPDSFTALGSFYFRDSKNVYYRKDILPVDKDTFVVIGDTTYAKDRDKVIRQGSVVEFADPETFVVSPGDALDWYATDKNHVYIRGYKNDWLDPRTFAVINQNYTKDADTVFLTLQFNPAGELPGADPNTFEILPVAGTRAGMFAPVESSFAKDVTHVYSFADVIKGADSRTFTVVNGRYGKDAKSVYYFDTLVAGADPATLESFEDNASFVKDANNVFVSGKLLAGADRDTFTLVDEGRTDANNWYNAQDKNRKYAYEEVVE
jgi:hypothetical protein